LKIAILSNTSFNIFNFRLGLILFLQSHGYEVVYIAPPDEYNTMIAAKTNAQFFPLKHMSRKGYNPFSDAKLIYEIRHIYKHQKIDVVLSYTIKPNIYGALATINLRTKSICNITGLGFVFLKKSVANTIAKQLFKISLHAARYAVFQNTSDLNLFVSKKLVSQNKTKLILGSGINIDTYNLQPATFDSKKFVFLFVGRLLFDKGVREFVEAAKKLQAENTTIEFQLLGSLDEGNPSAVSTSQLEQWLNKNKSLHFLNHQTDVIPFINQCDVVVLPSYREGMPRVILEAMAMQKPFITSDAPGCVDITEHGKNGLIAQTASVDDLYQQMKYILNMTEGERLQMGKNGRKMVEEKYDEKIIVQQYLKLIESIS
jgi:glycosyltransferase involved in cell wall biosynthesis